MRVQGRYVHRQWKFITTGKIVSKVSFSGSNLLFLNSESLYNLIYDFFMNIFPDQNGKLLKETPAIFNSDSLKTTLRGSTKFYNDPLLPISLPLHHI